MPRELVDRIDERAAADDRSRSYMINKILEEQVAAYTAEHTEMDAERPELDAKTFGTGNIPLVSMDVNLPPSDEAAADAAIKASEGVKNEKS